MYLDDQNERMQQCKVSMRKIYVIQNDIKDESIEKQIQLKNVYKCLSFFTKKLPDGIVYKIASLLNIIIQPYIFLCKYINLPMKNYWLNVFNKCGMQKRRDMIFDQLNPAYAKFYKKNEIEKELLDAGFTNLRFHHRHNYSWSIVGENN